MADLASKFLMLYIRNELYPVIYRSVSETLRHSRRKGITILGTIFNMNCSKFASVTQFSKVVQSHSRTSYDKK